MIKIYDDIFTHRSSKLSHIYTCDAWPEFLIMQQRSKKPMHLIGCFPHWFYSIKGACMIEISSMMEIEFTSITYPDDTVPYDKGTKITGNHNLTKKYISRNCQLKMFLTPFYWLQKSKKKLQSILMIQSLFSNRESYCLGVLDDYQPILSIDADLNDPRSVIQYGLDAALETAISSFARLRSSSQSDSRTLCWSSLSSCRSSWAIRRSMIMRGLLCSPQQESIIQHTSRQYFQYFRFLKR